MPVPIAPAIALAMELISVATPFVMGRFRDWLKMQNIPEAEKQRLDALIVAGGDALKAKLPQYDEVTDSLS